MIRAEDMNTDGAIALANAIVVSVCKSYRRTLKQLKKNPKSKRAMAEAMDCEKFFDGDWINVLTKVDGDYLKKKLREEALKE